MGSLLWSTVTHPLLDQIIKAVGQNKSALSVMLALSTRKGFIEIGADFQTSIDGLYAIGDCVRAWGSASTVMAVQDGKLAAESIHARLTDRAAIKSVSSEVK